MRVNQAKRLKELDKEKARLKKLVAEQARDISSRTLRQRLLQSSMFPAGVAFDGPVLRTPVTASFLEELRQIQEGKTDLASPMSASSDSWGWITRLAVPREGLAEACLI